MNFTNSTVGIIEKARAIATIYSTKEIVSNSNAAANAGIKMTVEVKINDKIIAAYKYLL